MVKKIKQSAILAASMAVQQANGNTDVAKTFSSAEEFQAALAAAVATNKENIIKRASGLNYMGKRMDASREAVIQVIADELELPIDEVRDELAAEIEQAAVEAHLAKLTEGAEIARPGEGLDPALLRDATLLDK